MCLILLKPPQVKLTEGLFRNVYQRNKDGFGYMYLNDKGVPVYEKFVPKRWEEAWEMYQPHQDRHIGLHWRLKTAGNISDENAHPYVVKDKEILMMHNGGISGHYDKEKSDSWMFAEQTIGPILEMFGKKAPEALKSEAFRRLVGGYIGGSSRLLFLTKQGFTGINDFIKADDGYVEALQGIFFSNTYAWDNQYWFKHATENDYNKGLVPSWRDRHSSTPYNGRYSGQYADYFKSKENGKETATEKTPETDAKGGEGTPSTQGAKTGKEGKETSDNGKHRGHANPHANIVRPISSHTLHLPKGRKAKAAAVANQLREAAAEKLLAKSIQTTLDNVEKRKNEEDTSQPETKIIKGQPVLLVKPEKLSAEKIVELANRGAAASALLVNQDKAIALPDDVGSQLHH